MNKLGERELILAELGFQFYHYTLLDSLSHLLPFLFICCGRPEQVQQGRVNFSYFYSLYMNTNMMVKQPLEEFGLGG